MSFNDIYERYKNGEASEQERKEVEEEIKKYKLLTDDYIENDDFFEDDSADNLELSQMKKKSKIRILLIIIASVIITSFIIMGAYQLYIHVISPSISKNIYYNPEKQTYDKYVSDFDASMSVMTDLHLPYQGYGGTTIERTGLGKYDLTLRAYKAGNNGPIMYDGKIDKNKIEINEGFFDFAPINIFVNSDPKSRDEEDKYVEAEYKNQIKALKKLPDNVFVSANISFNRDVSMDELSKIMKNNREVTFDWVGVRGVSKKRQRFPLIGFSPEQTGMVYSELNKEYSQVYMEDYYTDKLSKEMLETHFRSLIDFQLDNMDVTKEVSEVLESAYYKSTLKYVNKTGIYSYGIVVTGQPEDILNLLQMPEACYITSNDIEWVGF